MRLLSSLLLLHLPLFLSLKRNTHAHTWTFFAHFDPLGINLAHTQHVSLAFKMMQENPKMNVLAGFDASEGTEMRESIIFMVLGTDMAHHFDHLGQFQAQIMNTTADMTDITVRRKMLRMCLHCADVSNPTKKFSVYEKWAHKVMEEFYQQGDKERELGMTISPFMDRNNPQVAKCQLGFIKFIVRPLYLSFCELVTTLKDEVMGNLDKNVKEWERQKMGLESPVMKPRPDTLEDIAEVE